MKNTKIDYVKSIFDILGIATENALTSVQDNQSILSNTSAFQTSIKDWTNNNNVHLFGSKVMLNPTPNSDVKIIADPDSYEKIFSLDVSDNSVASLLFRNNTSTPGKYEPTIDENSNANDKAGLELMGNINQSNDVKNNFPIIRILPYVENGKVWQNSGYNYPVNRHYFAINGYQEGVGYKYLFEIDERGYIGIGTNTPSSKLPVTGLPQFSSNTAAIAGGITVGAFYHTSGTLKVVY